VNNSTGWENIGVRVGTACARLHDVMMRDLRVSQIQLDELTLAPAEVEWLQSLDGTTRVALLERWRSLTPVVAFVAVVTLATLASVDPLHSAEALSEAVKMLVLVWMIDVLVSDERRTRTAFWVIALSLGVLAIYAATHALARGTLLEAYRPENTVGGLRAGDGAGTFGDNNDLARVLVLSVPLWWALAARGAPAWSRAIAAAGCMASLLAIVCTFSRGGFLALLVAVGVIALSYPLWWRRAAVFLGFVAALVVLAPQPYLERMATIARPMADDSFRQRTEIWQRGAEIGFAHALLGEGPGMFQQPDLHTGMRHRAPHNIFVELIADVGIAGLAVFIWMLIAALLSLHRVRRGAPDASWAYAASFGLEAALLAYLTASMALSHALASPLFVLIGLTLALESAAPAARRPPG
jgi:O-antigen ligase